MAAVEINMPPVGGDVEGHWCAHEYVSDEGYYSGRPHLILEFFGGRPGYSACTLSDDLDLDYVMGQAAEAGWEKVSVSDCGYGCGEPHPALILTADQYLMIEAVAQKHGLRFIGTSFKTENELAEKARGIAGKFVGLRFDIWEAWVAYARKYGLKEAIRFAAEAASSPHLTPGRRQSYHTIVDVMKRHRHGIQKLEVLQLVSLFLMDRMRAE